MDFVPTLALKSKVFSQTRPYPDCGAAFGALKVGKILSEKKETCETNFEFYPVLINICVRLLFELVNNDPINYFKV